MDTKLFPSKLSKESGWALSDETWDPNLLGLREAQFAIGNGRLGCRGIYEELPKNSQPATFLAGFFDRTGSQVAELVNLPNPFQLWFSLKGEKLGIDHMDFNAHRRELDLKQGLLQRWTQYQDTRGRRYDYQSLRFLSMSDRSLGVLHIQITSLDGPADLTVEAALDTAVWNSGTVTEGRKKHWRIREVSHESSMEYVRISGLDEGHNVAYGAILSKTQDRKKSLIKDTHFSIHLKKGKPLTLTKFFVLHHSGPEEPSHLYQEVKKHLKKVRGHGLAKIKGNHVRAWKRLWERAEIRIKGDPEAQKYLRYSLYHLISAAPAPGSRVSIGAKALSGEGYRGHIFWDADLFLLPFYTHVLPEVAEEMLLYRYDRLEAARRIAHEKNYHGSMFPWESAGTGEEETPGWAKGLDGWITKIRTHLEEHHITADIAYAVDRFFDASGDYDLMLACGFEMLFSTARFWASRVEYVPKKDRFEIKKVIGPDEFHETIDNNAFTNYLARWNLLRSHHWSQKMASYFPEDYRHLCRRLNLTTEEIQNWKEIGLKIHFPLSEEKVLEQFDGYFEKREVPIQSYNEYGLPLVPEGFHWNTVGETQLVKQADVLLLFQLFPSHFTTKFKKNNYQFYHPRMIHQSSLSPATHAIVGTQIGEKRAAYQGFLEALNLDLEDVKGNTLHGIHAANLGNLWQAVIFGFGGIHFERDVLEINPKLPSEWEHLSFHFRWRGVLLKIDIQQKQVCIKAQTRKKTLPGRIKIFRRFQKIPLNRSVFFKKGR